MEKDFRKSKQGVYHINKALAELNISSKTELGSLLGVSGSAVGRWIAINSAPAWTDLAIECLFRRVQKHAAERTFILRVSKDKVPALESFLSAIGVTQTEISS